MLSLLFSSSYKAAGCSYVRLTWKIVDISPVSSLRVTNWLSEMQPIVDILWLAELEGFAPPLLHSGYTHTQRQLAKLALLTCWIQWWAFGPQKPMLCSCCLPEMGCQLLNNIGFCGPNARPWTLPIGECKGCVCVVSWFPARAPPQNSGETVLKN